MYVNFQLLLDRDLFPQDLIFLQAVKQQKTEDISNFVAMVMDDERYNFLTKKDYITQIKGTKNMSEIERIRLTKKGVKLLNELQVSMVTEEDLVLRDWLIEKYNDMGKIVGNKTKIGTGIAQFRGHTGIDKNKLAYLLQTFINDVDNMEYNQKLEKVLYSSKSVFATRFNINECRLNDYYLKNKMTFDKKFETL